MAKNSIKRLCYMMVISVTFLSFGTYVLLENFKPKTENINNDASEENAESSKETSKELTNNYLFEKTLSLAHLNFLSIKQFPIFDIKIASFSLKPNTPPPDLFES